MKFYAKFLILDDHSFFNNMTDIECLCRYIQCFSMFTIDRLTLKFLSTFSNILYQEYDFHEAKSQLSSLDSQPRSYHTNLQLFIASCRLRCKISAEPSGFVWFGFSVKKIAQSSDIVRLSPSSEN